MTTDKESAAPKLDHVSQQFDVNIAVISQTPHELKISRSRSTVGREFDVKPRKAAKTSATAKELVSRISKRFSKQLKGAQNALFDLQNRRPTTELRQALQGLLQR